MSAVRNCDSIQDFVKSCWSNSQRSMALEIREIDHLAVLGLAERFDLSAYDASYLWLAHELEVELVTLDRRLVRAADLLAHT